MFFIIILLNVLTFFFLFENCQCDNYVLLKKFWLFYRYLSLKNPQDSINNVEIPTYYNTGTGLECVNVESDDAVNNYETLSNNRVTDNVYNGNCYVFGMVLLAIVTQS
jgi:hypothetical protein